MGKHLVYLAGALAIVVVMCSIVSLTTDRESLSMGTGTRREASSEGTQATEAATTTNVWDYIRSRNGGGTVGDSGKTYDYDDGPELTIVVTLR